MIAQHSDDLTFTCCVLHTLHVQSISFHLHDVSDIFDFQTDENQLSFIQRLFKSFYMGIIRK